MLGETQCHPGHSHQAVWSGWFYDTSVGCSEELSVLELNEIELASGVESDVRVGHHVSVSWCCVVVDCCEDRLCHIPHCCSGWGHLVVGSDAVKVCCCGDPISCYCVEV